MRKNDALMTRARRVDPKPTNPFRGFADSPEAQEILTAILETPPSRGENTGVVRVRKPRHSQPLRAIAKRTVAVGVVAAVVLGIATIAAPDRPVPGSQTVWDAELVSVAEQSPRLLLSGDEWKVTRADEFSAELGEMTFENGEDCTLLPLKEGCYWLSLFWRSADTHDDYFEDRKHGADSSSKTTIDGHEAIVFEVDNSIARTYQAMWLDGEHSLELRSDVIPTLDEFNAIAATLQQVGVDTWLSAMPASVVKPDARDGVINRIIADIPVPSNVDLTELRSAQNVRDGYQLEYQVAETVICGWVQQWIDGTQAHDDAAVREAVAAMAGARDWRVMENYGGRSYVFDVADAMRTGAEINGNAELPTGVYYQRHLGCPES